MFIGIVFSGRVPRLVVILNLKKCISGYIEMMHLHVLLGQSSDDILHTSKGAIDGGGEAEVCP